MGFTSPPQVGIAGQYLRSATLVVAASNSRDNVNADYVCDGTADQVEINSAITALGTVGGTVMLLEGTYSITASVNLASNVAIVGQGAGTLLRVPDGHNAGINVISGSGIDHVLVANLKVDGNRANQAAPPPFIPMRGIEFNTVTHSKIVNCWAEEFSRNGIYLHGLSNYNTIAGNTCQGNTWEGIYLNIPANNYNTIIGNTCIGNDYDGILVSDSNHNTIIGNVCQGNTLEGIYLVSSDYNAVIGNICQGNGWDGIYLQYSDHNTVEGNDVEGNSQGANNTDDGILVDRSDYNNIQGNTVRRGIGANTQRYGINISNAACDGNLVASNDLYNAGTTANLSDVGTGTVVRDNRGWVTENNVLSPAFAIDAIAVVTVTIPHGLAVTPAVEDCQLTVVEDTDVDDWQEGYHKVESVDAANVVAKVNVTTASVTGGATAQLALHVDLTGG